MKSTSSIRSFTSTNSTDISKKYKTHKLIKYSKLERFELLPNLLESPKLVPFPTPLKLQERNTTIIKIPKHVKNYRPRKKNIRK